MNAIGKEPHSHGRVISTNEMRYDALTTRITTPKYKRNEDII